MRGRQNPAAESCTGSEQSPAQKDNDSELITTVKWSNVREARRNAG